MQRLAAVLVLILMTGCGPSGPGSTPTRTTGHPATASPGQLPPAPDAPILTNPEQLATSLATIARALDASAGRWIRGEQTLTQPPQTVMLLALCEQRVYGKLATHRTLASEVMAALPNDLAREATANVTADRELRSLISNTGHAPPIRTRAPLPAGVLLGYYKEAERRFHVKWQVLAAINFVESKFGRVVSSSSAGAQGPMQFIASTWKSYGMGGDVHDPHDAIMGAANYLHAAGAPANYQQALYAYNPAKAYVDAVLIYARQMRRDPLAYFEYYNWQVFVVTSST